MEPPLCVVSSWIIRVYTILIWNTISGSSNLDNCFYHCLILISISHLKTLFIIIIIITTTTTITILIVVVVVVVVIVLLLFIIYIVNLLLVRPRSCRVIYYFDTPALGRRHQSFSLVNHLLKQSTEPCLLLAMRSFGCVVSLQNSVSVQFILLHFMLTTLVSSKLQPILSITNAPSTLRLTVTQSGKHMIIKLSPFHISPPLYRSQISSPNPCPVSAIISSLANWCLSIYQHQFKGGCQRKYLYLHI